MKTRSFITLAAVLFVFSAVEIRAQESNPSELVRPRVVAQNPVTAPVNPPLNQRLPVNPNVPLPGGTAPAATVSAETQKTATTAPLTYLTPSLIQSRISEARRMLKTRPMATALSVPSIEFVTIAALDRENAKTHLITLSKESFLTKGAQVNAISSLGTNVTVNVLRANGVNTALTIFTQNGQSLAPLTVEYPIERNGLFREMAYYTSAHPALLSNDLVRSGQSYIRNMLDLAATRLRDRGVPISPQIVDVAERLCVVEHVDHERFRAENRIALYEEIYSLFALNELDTYRFSVSSAGAGGVVQMIPWAYNLERTRHPGVGLIPDFVTGMRNHANALQAMLLYMNDTWGELTANDEVKNALATNIATPNELLAAAYNSNAAKLPLYLKRGGDAWRTLIPRETQMYLQIYKSFESLVPLKTRTPVTPVTASAIR
ncbi:MAG TPA: hypothetical protein VJ749_08330 [Pyrinomonadaceae bacterium]|nr:hypothetical protein [Pyrinomonadaceae bacterium]